MKSTLKSFILILTFFIASTTVCFAQKDNKAAYLISAKSKSDRVRIHGRLIAINDTALVIADKKDKLHYMAFSKINSIRVDKNRSDVGFGLFTTAAIAGNIVLATTIESALTAVIVGAGGTVGIVIIMSAIHGFIHPAELKLRSDLDNFSHEVLTQKLSPYLVKSIEVRP